MTLVDLRSYSFETMTGTRLHPPTLPTMDSVLAALLDDLVSPVPGAGAIGVAGVDALVSGRLRGRRPRAVASAMTRTPPFPRPASPARWFAGTQT